MLVYFQDIVFAYDGSYLITVIANRTSSWPFAFDASDFLFAIWIFINYLERIATKVTFDALFVISITLISFALWWNKKVEHVIREFSRGTCCKLCCLPCTSHLCLFDFLYHNILQLPCALPLDWSTANRHLIIVLAGLNVEFWLINGCEALSQGRLITILHIHELIDLA